MQGLALKLGGKNLLFATTGDVAVVDATGPTTVGTWTTTSSKSDNKVSYTISNAAQDPLQATYTFNGTNQLVMALPGDAGAPPASFTFQGRISVDRDHNIAYTLVDDTGKDTAIKISVYATKMDFAEQTNNLVITLAGGGTAQLTGESGVQSLEAERNHLPSFKGRDLLTFQAVTRNPVGGDVVAIPAELDFVGSWNLNGDKLVFISEVKSGSRPSVSIGFAGRIKGVTAGFVYFADGKTTDVAFNIRGQHTFKSTNAVTDLTWETSIGFSGKTFRAAVDVDLIRTTATGGILDLTGKLRLEKKGTAAPTFDLHLQAKYTVANGTKAIAFTANITGGDQPSYDLGLQGTFLYANRKLTFAIQYTNIAGAGVLHAQIGAQGSTKDLISNLSLILDVSQEEAELKLNLSFEVHLRFANGVLVKEIPPAVKPAAAATSN